MGGIFKIPGKIFLVIVSLIYSNDNCEIFVRLGKLGGSQTGLNMSVIGAVVSPAEPQWILLFGFRRLGSVTEQNLGTAASKSYS